MARTRTSKAWMREHVNDVYVQKAKQAGYRSRSAYKLLEIQEKDKLVRPGMTVVDLGAAPGGWSQVLASLVGAPGQVIAVDLLEMEPLRGVELIRGDFLEKATLELMEQRLGERRIDLVVSDMAPNISGNRTMDQPRTVALLDEALVFAREVLRPGGDFLAKAFQGEGIDVFTRDLKKDFRIVKTLKPKASRPESREIYLLARRFAM